jgi:hypothetical protein
MSVLFNASEVAEIAAAQFGDALLDDPSRWPANTSIAPADVIAVCEETARENAHSAVTQEITRHKSTLIHECLAVAPDPNAAFQRLVPGLAPDFAEGWTIAKNTPEKWAQEREPMFLRAVAKAIAAMPLRSRTMQEILAYAARDDRLARPGLRKALSATRLPDDAPAMPEDTPAFLRPAQTAPLEDDWGGAFDVPAQAAPAPLEDGWGGAFDVPAQTAPAPAPLEDDRSWCLSRSQPVTNTDPRRSNGSSWIVVGSSGCLASSRTRSHLQPRLHKDRGRTQHVLE